jgi:hypothetical protein
VAESARYLYAISRGLRPEGLAGTPGLGGGRLELVEHRGLTAVVSDVDLEEYGEEGLRKNLERLDWLEEVARAHDAVVQTVATLGPTAPLRLATICLDDDGVRSRLDEWHDALEQVLDRVEGRLEWSVKVIAPVRAAGPAAASVASSGMGGAEYLRRKKAATEARYADEEVAIRVADEVHAALSEGTAASRRLPPQDPRLTGHQGTMLLNAAYLVGAEDGPAFEARVQSLAEANPDVGIECRGPWPPYSFATLEQ